MKKHLNIKYNEEEWHRHEWLKDFFGFRGLMGEESQTSKMAENVAFNILRAFFGDELSQIFKLMSREKLHEIRVIQQERIRKSNTANFED